MPESVIDRIFEVFAQRGDNAYLGEPVSQQEHALQAAHLARTDNAPATLIAAAILHDYGHLIHGLPEDIADQGIDGVHEEVGCRYLSQYFVPALTDPVRLHVPAKRYLCATDSGYFATLSPASVKSLELQGGPFSPDQIRDFEALPHYQDAVRLRRYDDQGKVPNLDVPSLTTYRPYLKAGLKTPQ
jgi:phosphonate degradation associated HDIG domain protein